MKYFIDFCLIGLFLLFINSTNAQTEMVPWAELEGAWTLPFYFEDATGSRDSLYIVYQPGTDAGVLDSLYGEYRFNAEPDSFVACVLDCEENYIRAFVSDEIIVLLPVKFKNALLPIKISTHNSYTYTDDLPFAYNPESPQVLIELRSSGFEECDTAVSANEIIYITDTLLSASRCIVDSVATLDEPSILEITLRDWAAFTTSLELPSHSKDECPTNPRGALDYEYLGIFDLLGRRLISGKQVSVREALDIDLNKTSRPFKIPDNSILLFQTPTRTCSLLISGLLRY